MQWGNRWPFGWDVVIWIVILRTAVLPLLLRIRGTRRTPEKSPLRVGGSITPESDTCLPCLQPFSLCNRSLPSSRPNLISRTCTLSCTANTTAINPLLHLQTCDDLWTRRVEWWSPGAGGLGGLFPGTNLQLVDKHVWRSNAQHGDYYRQYCSIHFKLLRD